MSILGRLFGVDGSSEHNPETVAQAIVGRYQQRRARGELRVDDRLLLELCHVLPQKDAQDVFERFRTRRARSDPKAEYLLVMDIGVAMHDVEHYARTFMRKRDPVAPGRSRPSAANTYAKASVGAPIADEDEDAVLFEGLLRDE